MIANFTGGEVLNQRGEWGQNLPPRLVVTDGRDGTEKASPNDEESRKNLADTGTKRGGEPSSSQNTKRPKIMAKTCPETGQKENQASIITDPQNSKKKKKSKLPEKILDIFEEIGTEGSGPKLAEALTTIEAQRIKSIS